MFIVAISVEVKKLNTQATAPRYAYLGDAGFDLHSSEEVVIASGEYKAIHTGISIAIPEGYVGLIWDKSSVGIKQGIKTLGGVIDCSYRVEIIVGLANLSGESRPFMKGDKIAQMIIQKKETVDFKIVEELSIGERGDRGFGSSGK